MRPWIKEFRDTITTSTDRLQAIDESTAGIQRGSDWSPKQVIGHLIDSAANNHARFVLAQTKDDLIFPGYDGDMWVGVQRYQNSSWLELVDLWRAYNLHLAHVMSSTADEKLTSPRSKHSLQTIAFVTVSESESTTLEYLMKDYIAHLKHHLDQIFSKAASAHV